MSHPYTTKQNEDMKQGMMIAAFTLLMAASAQGQERQVRTPQERAKAQTERMTRELALSPDQAAKVEAIHLKYAEQAEVMRKEREAQRAAMEKEGKGKDMRAAREADMKAVLTSEQYEKWLAQREAMKEQHMQQRKESRDDQKERE